MGGGGGDVFFASVYTVVEFPLDCFFVKKFSNRAEYSFVWPDFNTSFAGLNIYKCTSSSGKRMMLRTGAQKKYKMEL